MQVKTPGPGAYGAFSDFSGLQKWAYKKF
jgi:hypothetical protein